MSESLSEKARKISKPTAAVAGMGLALGLGWTLSSGFKGLPAEVVSSSQDVRIASSYRGFCHQISVFEGERELQLSDRDVGRGLARFGLHLKPGQHDLRLRFKSLVPGLERDYPLTVVVDEEAPSLSAGFEEAPGETRLVTTDESLTLAGHLEVGSSLFLEGVRVPTNEDGSFTHQVKLKPGWNHLLLAGVDRAGNRTRRNYSAFRDVDDPEIAWQTKPDEVFSEKQARLVLDFKDDGSIAAVSGKVDGKHPIEWSAKGANRWVGLTGDLHEGFHTVSVSAVDASGRVVAGERQIIIDSSETFGDSTLGLGARGQDVKLLHERLSEAGYLSLGEVGSIFTRATEAAVKKFQEDEGFEVSGRAEGQTLIALGPRIFINLSNFSLVLERPGKEQKRWRIASGSHEHPTPVGRYYIYEKVYHPTWLPPKSDWAKDAKPIPPGPGNPLGTRWLGFDWGGVGIHGTNAPWTVGSAASHGCLRMVTEQVEELYELVEVGTPVIVLGGWENDPVLDRYWPEPKPVEETAEVEAESSSASLVEEEAALSSIAKS